MVDRLLRNEGDTDEAVHIARGCGGNYDAGRPAVEEARGLRALSLVEVGSPTRSPNDGGISSGRCAAVGAARPLH